MVDLNNFLQILQILSILGGVAALWIRIEKRLAVQEFFVKNTVERLERIDKEIEKLATITVEIARQDERMSSQDTRIDQLCNRLDTHINKDHKQIRLRSRG